MEAVCNLYMAVMALFILGRSLHGEPALHALVCGKGIRLPCSLALLKLSLYQSDAIAITMRPSC